MEIHYPGWKAVIFGAALLSRSMKLNAWYQGIDIFVQSTKVHFKFLHQTINSPNLIKILSSEN